MIETVEAEAGKIQDDNICHSTSSTADCDDQQIHIKGEFSYHSDNDTSVTLCDASMIQNEVSTCDIQSKPVSIDADYLYAEETEALSPTSSSKVKPNYHRHPKPPFSYIALIAMAIKDSPSGKLTLAEINEYLIKRFSFFRGSYTGWRNSVRHNLSLNECFVKVLRDPSRPWGKDNYWTINEHSEYTFADGVFRRRRKRIHRNDDRNMSSKSDLHHHRKFETKKKFTGPFSIDNILGNTGNEDDNSNKSIANDSKLNSQKTLSDICLGGWNYSAFSPEALQQYSVKSSGPEMPVMTRTISFPVYSFSSSTDKRSIGFHNNGLTNQRFEAEHFQFRVKPEMSSDLRTFPNFVVPSDVQRETVSMPFMRLPFYFKSSVKRSSSGPSCFSVESIIS